MRHDGYNIVWPDGVTHGTDRFHLDANESAFFLRQLEYIKAKTYDVKYRDLLAFSFLPISNEAPSGATQITWRQYVGVGFAKIIQDYSKDFPRVDTYGVENTTKIYGIGASYGYSVVEIRRAQMANVPLDQKKANFARRAIEQVINTLAWVGNSAYAINGFLKFPGITGVACPAVGSGTVTNWSAKTPTQIIADMTAMVQAIVNTTNGKEIPTDLLLPVQQFLYIASTWMGTPSNVTILEFFLDSQKKAGLIQRVEMLPDLVGIGTSGNNSTTSGETAPDRAFMYTRDEDHVTLEIPQPFEQFPMDQKGMDFEVTCHAETAGVLVYYPLAVCYMDGI